MRPYGRNIFVNNSEEDISVTQFYVPRPISCESNFSIAVAIVIRKLQQIRAI